VDLIYNIAITQLKTCNLFAGKPTRYPDPNKIPAEVSAGTERAP